MSDELLRFGPFELDPASEELRRSGLAVRIPRQPLRILLLLVRRAGEVVSRDEIHAAIWGNETYVDFEHGINTATGHAGGAEAAVLVLLLPALIFCWGVAAVLIAALV